MPASPPAPHAARRRSIRAARLLLAALLLAAPACSGSDPAKEGWSLVWHEEFDASAVDLSTWNFWVTGNPYNNELQYYTNRAQNARIEDGRLVIEAHEEEYTGSDGTREFTSARMHTQGKADFLYGRFEIRARLPFGQGLWPAIWMMPTYSEYGGWPRSGEIDIMELLGQDPAKTYGTIHYTDTDGAPQHSGGSYTLPSGTFYEAFHTFALEWEEGVMRWFVDDVLILTRTAWGTAGHAFPAPFDRHFHLILNVAVGGDWPGSPDATTIFPQRMEVDWIRAFERVE
jgi:beta-glucanase (GH16 family)